MEIIGRASAIYIFLWLVTRALGKRELAEMTAFELVLLMVMGDLIQQGVTQEDTSVTGAVLAVGTISMWILGVSWVGFRWRGARRIVEGAPVVVVRDGRPLLPALKIERVTLDEVLEAARQHGISNLRDVDLGILEPDGRFSFLTGSQDHQPAPERHKG
jgi:uncharacterized membrane protein YcaP (DUF421 family)